MLKPTTLCSSTPRPTLVYLGAEPRGGCWKNPLVLNAWWHHLSLGVCTAWKPHRGLGKEHLTLSGGRKKDRSRHLWPQSSCLQQAFDLSWTELILEGLHGEEGLALWPPVGVQLSPLLLLLGQPAGKACTGQPRALPVCDLGWRPTCSGPPSQPPEAGPH